MKKIFKILAPIIIISLIFVLLLSITNSQNQQSAERKKQQEALQASMHSTEDSIKSTDTQSKTSSPENPSSEQNAESTTADSKHSKFNLYVFWGDGCPHCENFFNFIKTLPEEYTSLYNLYAFEVWNNQDNSNLMKEFSSLLKADASSVPFIIIGDQTFKGYSEKTSESIKSAIKTVSAKSATEKSQIDAYQKVLSSRK